MSETATASAQDLAAPADPQGVTATDQHTAPRITAADVKAAATRLAGVIVLDVADLTIAPALFDAKAGEFRTLDGTLLGADDGTLIVLVEPGAAGDLIAEHGRPTDAAAALTRRLRHELAR